MMLEKTFAKKTSIVTREVAGETILVPITGNIANMQKIFSLNPVGEFIWSKMDGTLAASEIVTLLQGEFDVEKHEAEADCIAFLQSLLETELIVEV